MNRIFSLLLLHYIPLAVFANAFILSRPFALQDELPSNEVWRISQDKDGYIWFCTDDGLSRYDGHELVTFRKDLKHPDLLPSNEVTQAQDDGRKIWIGTKRGIRLLDKQSHQFIVPKDSLLANGNTTHILVQSNKVWVALADNVLCHCTAEGEVIKRFDIGKQFGSYGSVQINALFLDNHGQMWIPLGAAGIFFYDPDRNELVKLQEAPEVDYFSIYQDSTDRYWLGIWGEGIYEYCPSRQENRFVHHSITNPKTQRNDNKFFSIITDDQSGYLWLMSYNQLYAVKIEEQGGLTPIDLDSIIETHEMYTGFLKDREGNLWLSSYGTSRIISFDQKNIHQFPLRQIQDKWGWGTNVVDFKLSEKGFGWVAQDRLGLCLYEFGKDKLQCVSFDWNFHFVKSVATNHVWCYIAGRGTFECYESKGGNPARSERVELRNTNGSLIHVDQAVEDGQENLWVLSEEGSLYVRQKQGRLICKEAKDDSIANLMLDNKGNVWSMGPTGRLIRHALVSGEIRNEVKSRYHFQSVPLQVEIADMDEEGCLWVTTPRGALFRSEHHLDEMTRLQIDSLAAGASPIALVCKGDYVFLLTRKVLLRINRHDNRVESLYFAKDIDISMSAFSNAIDVALDGKIYVGGQDKVICIEDKGQYQPRWDYAPLVTDMKLNDTSIFFPTPTAEAVTLELYPGTCNIEIDFSNMHYGIQAEPRIAYMLEGIDKDWHTLPVNRFSAYYNRLPKGSYRLHVKHEYIPGRWAEEQNVLSIRQLPFWYETYWAYSLYILLGLGVVYLLLTTPFEKQRLRELMHELKHNRIRREVALGSINDETDISENDQELIERITQITEQHLCNPDFSVEDLADELGMSKATLHRRVSAATCMTPLNFIKSKRIARACQLLATTQLSVSEIAYETGFTNPKYFTKCFKESMQMTPKEFKNTQQEEK